MYRSIIVPVDGSSRSHAALPLAAILARGSDATLDFVRVHLHERPDLDGDPSWDDMFREGELAYLQSLAIAYESVAGRQVGVALLEPPVVDSLVEFAAARVAPLFVIAGRGRTGIRRALLGSTSDGLVRYGDAPVLILRTPDEDRPMAWSRLTRGFRRIVVPLDGTAHAEASVPHAVAIAKATGAKLRLVRVVGPVMSSAVVGAFAMHPLPPYDEATVTRNDLAHEYLQGVVDRISVGAASLDVSTEVSLATDAATAIVESARRTVADLVVMSTHGRGISRLLRGAVGDRVLRDGPDAILFVHPAKSSVPPGLKVSGRKQNTAQESAAPVVTR